MLSLGHLLAMFWQSTLSKKEQADLVKSFICYHYDYNTCLSCRDPTIVASN
jgi:hypothetical protein